MEGESGAADDDVEGVVGEWEEGEGGGGMSCFVRDRTGEGRRGEHTRFCVVFILS